MPEEVVKGLTSAPPNYRILRQIIFRIEIRMRIQPAPPANQLVVKQGWIAPGPATARLAQVMFGVEQRMGAAAFFLAKLQVMLYRRYARERHIGIDSKIIGLIENPAFFDQPRCQQQAKPLQLPAIQ